MSAREDYAGQVAVIGLEARFPGAPGVDAYWDLLREGREGVRFLSDDELRRAGLPEGRRPRAFVNAVADLPEIDRFDASFFGVSPSEAEVMDPQFRLLLEAAVGVLHHAGHDPQSFRGPIGVFAGAGMSGYLQENLWPNRELLARVGALQLNIVNALDSLASLVSYKLNLTGPSLTVQTACSTSLVAVHLACQSLLSGECDLALAGGVSVKADSGPGYLHQEGGIFSRDGHTRSFDARASGTVMGQGVGLVALRRMEDAVADGDFVHAVILGSAVNNDGAAKGGYTAPSVTGHARVVSEALGMARVSPRSIGYLEAHGTATEIGDPIEVEGLTRAFREGTADRGFCALGSAKTNLGHLDHAAGVAGLIKAVLALRHRQLPPSLHFEAPNPRIDFAASPFRVNTRLAPWPAEGGPRRAGVSSLGIGGTNAHVVLQEPPERVPAPAEPRRPRLFRISARSEAALEAASARLAAHLLSHEEQALGDVAHTLAVGRPRYASRRIVVCESREELRAALEGRDPERVATGLDQSPSTPCAFLFPGQGAQQVGMGAGLHERFPVFREELERCARGLEPHLGRDLRGLLLSERGPHPEELDETRLAQPALFAVEFALARLWMTLGAQPRALLGHSLGEWVAATLAGVFRLEHALELVALRGRLMQERPRGAMLAVPLPAEEVLADAQGLDLAAVNGARACVLSGPEDAVEALAASLARRGIEGRRLRTSHGFHSAAMDAVLEPFAEAVSRVPRGAPSIPFVSNVTGEWITPELAQDPAYWARQLRAPVLFSAGVGTLLRESPMALLEVGPGQSLAGLVRPHPGRGAAQPVFSSLPGRNGGNEAAHLLGTAGRLWISGVSIGAVDTAGEPTPRRVPLPGYPFERKRYWVDRPRVARSDGPRPPSFTAGAAGFGLYRPAWRGEGVSWRSAPSAGAAAGPWSVVGGDGSALGAALVARLRARGEPVEAGWPRPGVGPVRIVHLESLASADGSSEVAWERGFHALRQAARRLEDLSGPVRVHVVTRGAAAFGAGERLRPENGVLAAVARVLGQEVPHASCGVIDVVPPEGDGAATLDLATLLEAELTAPVVSPLVACRSGLRFTPDWTPVLEGEPAPASSRIVEGGAYVITGGLGRVGLLFARALAERAPVKLTLLGRRGAASLAEDGTDRAGALRGLEALGSEVQVVAADAAEPEALFAALAATREKHGAIRGVIHAAGVLDAKAWSPLRELTPDECARQFRPKVDALQALARALEEDAPEFVVVVSSLSTALGGIGYGAYAAANAFMDAFVEEQHAAGRRHWMSLAFDSIASPGAGGSRGSAGREPALAPAAVGEALHRALALRPASRLMVSAADLPARVEASARPADRARSAAAAERPGGEAGPAAAAAHPRPNLLNAFVAPETETERRLALLWGEHLRIDRIGRHDNFFELGGTSLTAVQMMPRIGAAFRTDLPVAALFEGPTVHSMSRIIEERLAAGEALEPAASAADGSEE